MSHCMHFSCFIKKHSLLSTGYIKILTKGQRKLSSIKDQSIKLATMQRNSRKIDDGGGGEGGGGGGLPYSFTPHDSINTIQ